MNGQTRKLSLREVVTLMGWMELKGCDAEIDWVNRTIRVLSPVMTNEAVMLSDGPMTYQDIYYEISG